MSTEQDPGQSGSKAPMSKEGNTTNEDTKCMGIVQYQWSGMDLTGSVMKIEERSSEAAKNQPELSIHFTEDSILAMGTLKVEKVHETINQFEGSLFKDNPRLKKKSISLLFEVHLEREDEGCSSKKTDDLPNVEVRTMLKRLCSTPATSP
ncbi:keratin-like protein KRT222 [Anomaloglossus baeobatrachus]|uniref:keratin-like protein KRT222 n=1 Tax=Anomaloglossus baeobatrachus TaxID=238106 RepID=UPI003F4FB048